MSDEKPFDPIEEIRQGHLPDDAGGYIGRQPELGSDVIAGGIQDKDERIAGTATQSSGAGAERGQVEPDPQGHRERDHVSDDDIRRAGTSS